MVGLNRLSEWALPGSVFALALVAILGDGPGSLAIFARFRGESTTDEFGSDDFWMRGLERTLVLASGWGIAVGFDHSSDGRIRLCSLKYNPHAISQLQKDRGLTHRCTLSS